MFDWIPTGANTIVEIGSQWGWWAARAAQYMPDGCSLYCVDPWVDNEEAGCGLENYAAWIYNLRKYHGKTVFDLQGTSENVGRGFDRDVDFLFIDGDHTREGVSTDLRTWEPKVIPGGVIVGHDWVHQKYAADVQGAVCQYFNVEAKNVEIQLCYWRRPRGPKLSQCWVWRK
jgi:predicted O-methyltransferase YrrM